MSATAASQLPPQAVVMQMVMGGWIARTISEVSRLDVPDALQRGGPMTAAALVDGGIPVEAGALERALRALASVGLFTEDDGARFGLTPLGDAMKANSENSMRGVLEKCDFSGVTRVADIGGGFGHLVIALLEKNPALKGVLMDVPELIPVAKARNPAPSSVAARLEYHAGNMFESVPAADAYVMKHIIHDWDDERCLQLLRNCHRSMQGAGRVICVDAVLPPFGDTSGTAAKLLDLLMMAGIRGKERTRTQWEGLYAAAGFRVARVTPLQDNFGTSIVEGVKA